MLTDVRLDKYLWSIRMYKTRSLATEKILSSKVKSNGKALKPSKKVQVGDIYEIKKEGLYLEIEVTELVDKRVAYEKAILCYKENKRIEENKTQLESVFLKSNVFRQKGAGRPTKKDRRKIDEQD